ncbi:hypothetical protein [Catenulispora subtropica]|uniref:PE-PGRS family protein n=1 Tax=Catenulispora subtropica TaxID=450798 RepID=A0ABN2RIM8_9ACTN
MERGDGVWAGWSDLADWTGWSDWADWTGWSDWAALEDATPKASAQWVSALSYNRNAPAELIIELFDGVEGHYRFTPLARHDLPAAARDAALTHPNLKVRLAAAEHGHLTPDQWDRLIASFDDEAGRAFAERRRAEHTCFDDAVPPSTPAEIAEWAAQVPEPHPGLATQCPWWIAALHDNADAMRQLATSPNPAVRRSVAHARYLPPDVLEMLLRDHDPAIPVILAGSCDDTPPDVLLDVWNRWPRGLPPADPPRSHPNFPKTGLLHHADDPDPHLRILALSDEAADADLVDRLAGDPDPFVRAEALLHPRLSPAAHVAALLDETSAYAAARNPALPVPVMRHMVDIARRAG